MRREKNEDQLKERRGRDIVLAFKQLQKAVQLRPRLEEDEEIGGLPGARGTATGVSDPPLCFPTVGQ